jgi:fibro-slime domain-containing protein
MTPRLALVILLAAVPACGPKAGGDDTGADDDAGDDDDDGPRPDARDTPPGMNCGVLTATVRDFQIEHPDMEEPDGDSDFSYPGLVEASLGSDNTPVYAHDGAIEPHIDSPDSFAQWYHDVDGVNQKLETTIELMAVGGGVYRYDNPSFFPIDGQGFGNEELAHNFHFTTEIHTTFEYEGGETFTFRGDDDLWLFINGHLAIDLGGLHPPLEQTVDLDAKASELGITVGGTYSMDIFHAERHTEDSNFRIDTTIDCFVVP